MKSMSFATNHWATPEAIELEFRDCGVVQLSLPSSPSASMLGWEMAAAERKPTIVGISHNWESFSSPDAMWIDRLRSVGSLRGFLVDEPWNRSKAADFPPGVSPSCQLALMSRRLPEGVWVVVQAPRVANPLWGLEWLSAATGGVLVESYWQPMLTKLAVRRLLAAGLPKEALGVIPQCYRFADEEWHRKVVDRCAAAWRIAKANEAGLWAPFVGHDVLYPDPMRRNLIGWRSHEKLAEFISWTLEQVG